MVNRSPLMAVASVLAAACRVVVACFRTMSVSQLLQDLEVAPSKPANHCGTDPSRLGPLAAISVGHSHDRFHDHSHDRFHDRFRDRFHLVHGAH